MDMGTGRSSIGSMPLSRCASRACEVATRSVPTTTWSIALKLKVVIPISRVRPCSFASQVSNTGTLPSGGTIATWRACR